MDVRTHGTANGRQTAATQHGMSSLYHCVSYTSGSVGKVVLSVEGMYGHADWHDCVGNCKIYSMVRVNKCVRGRNAVKMRSARVARL